MDDLQNRLPGFGGLLAMIFGLTILAMVGHWLVSGDRLSVGLDWTISTYLFWPLVLGVAWLVASRCERFVGGFAGALMVELAGIHLAGRVTLHLGITGTGITALIVGIVIALCARPQFGPNT
jgi:hypothetical protein